MRAAKVLLKAAVCPLLMAAMLFGQAAKPGAAKPQAGKARAAKTQTGSDGLVYVWIPPGTFQMGCSTGNNECNFWEKPAHTVTITRGFWMGRTEVTVGAYKRFAGATGHALPPERISKLVYNPGWADESQPIVWVTWDEAGAYCQWAGGRLPSAAEWEYAARGGTSAARYGKLDAIAWYPDNSGKARLDSTSILGLRPDDYYTVLYENQNGPHRVGQKTPNAFGLYDMLGNAAEWTADWYEEAYYTQSPSEDPRGPSSGESRELRGGAWDDAVWLIRVSGRGGAKPSFRTDTLGFRCVREAP